MALGASLRRRTKVALVVAVFLVGLLAGDMLGDHNILGGINDWLANARRAEYEEAFAEHADRAYKEFEAVFGERYRALQDEIAPFPPVSPETLALLADVEALRRALSLDRRSAWEGFRMEEDSPRFRTVRPMTLADLPEEARDLIDRIAAWDAANPDAHWGEFDEAALEIASPADALFCTDKFQLALAEVIPPDHGYWRTMARLVFLSNPCGSPMFYRWSRDYEAVLRWLVQADEEGRALVRENINPPSRIRDAMLSDGLHALFYAVIGLEESFDYMIISESEFVAPPPVPVEDVEKALHALEVLGAGREQGESWLPQAAGLLAGLEARRDFQTLVFGMRRALAASEEQVYLWRWAVGEEAAPPLNADVEEGESPKWYVDRGLLTDPVEAQ